MRASAFTLLATLIASAPALAEGDIAAGEKAFKKCKACHTIADGETIIYKGGKTGPNLFGVIGRTAGTVEGFRYGDDIIAAGAAGLVWDEANIIDYMSDPKTFIRGYLDDSKAKSKMAFKLTKGGEDVAAYLSSVAATQ